MERTIDDVDKGHPVIVWQGPSVVDGDYKVYVDGITVASGTCLIKAFKSLLCTFYAFNLAFPVKNHSTLTFLQKVLVNHSDGAKQDIKVVKLLARLNQV